MSVTVFRLGNIKSSFDLKVGDILFYHFCWKLAARFQIVLKLLAFIPLALCFFPCFAQNDCPPDVYEIKLSYNRTTRIYVFRCDTKWEVPEYLDEGLLDSPVAFIVAGGGGGGMGESAGGGGAGGIVYSTVNLKPGNIVTVHIGKGGEGSLSYNNKGGRGGNTVFAGNVALGGGGGGSSYNLNGGRGGSGGGAAAYNDTGVSEGTEGNHAFRGGNANRNNDNVRAGGGGGGSGGPGAHGAPPNPGEGGLGRTTNLLSGVPISFIRNAFAAGGGSTGRNPSLNASFFSNGGRVHDFILGGNGNINEKGKGGKGLTNTGSGGGAGRGAGGDGGTGVVVLRMEFGILPVNWAYVKSHFNPVERSASVNWATSKEWENSHFEIERSLTGFSDWVKIGEVSGMGWTENLTEYSFSDNHMPLAGGSVFYRLKQVDFNLHFEYSKITSVKIPAIQVTKGKWMIYPNPIIDENFKISRTEMEEISAITFRLISGEKQYRTISVKNEKEMTEAVKIISADISKGVFVVEIEWNNQKEYLKILKK